MYPPCREFSKFLKNKIRMPWVSLGGERGWGGGGAGGWAQVVELTDA